MSNIETMKIVLLIYEAYQELTDSDFVDFLDAIIVGIFLRSMREKR